MSTIIRPASSYFSFVPGRDLLNNITGKERAPVNGIRPVTDFTMYVAPASGPTGFVTMGFEKRFREAFAAGEVEDGVERWFVGASTGALRFTALVADLAEDPKGKKQAKDRTDALADHFIFMTYKYGDTPESLRPLMEKTYSLVMPSDMSSFTTHPTLHVAIMVSSITDTYTRHIPWLLPILLSTHFAAHILTPSTLRHLFRRHCFYTGPAPPTHLLTTAPGEVPITFHPLTESNIQQVLHATCCIPYLQKPCRYIDGVGEGYFLDGGFTDFTLGFTPRVPTLILSDSRDVKAVFFDFLIPWRGASVERLALCGVVAPTVTFKRAMEGAVFPAGWDWFTPWMVGDPERRRRMWREVYEASVKEFPAVFAGDGRGQ
ncbi:hypothetical protein HK104_003966 [Borealophlyctis nickersoniae]|nr:hypothetical protein HK104_003966 [Borealophlyctis nickersoniae]